MHLPHVTPFARRPVYFLTACTAHRRSVLACAEAHACLRALWSKSFDMAGWSVGRYVLMPDHVHLFAAPSEDARSRAEWVKAWKSASSRILKEKLELAMPLWQAEVFDHILRSSESYSEKWEYIRNNPIRKNLVTNPDEWPWQGEIGPLEF